jgi:hypothetical protein
MRNHRRAERRPARPIGPMRERELETTSGFVALLHRFGILDKDQKLSKHQGWSEYQRVERDPVVSRVREKLRSDGELRKGSGLFSAVHETEQALVVLSKDPDALLRLRARMFLNDFRLGPEDKEEKTK